MVTKQDIKRLLAKGLTGLEAARLIIEDSVQVEHGREGCLSSADIRRIKNSLVSQADIQEYNQWIRVYQLVDFSIKEASIHALEANIDLLLAARELERYRYEDMVRQILIYDIPAIVTQKQYDELRARQKEIKLKELHTFRFVLSSVAEGLTPEDIQAQWKAGDEGGCFEYLLDYLEDAQSDYYGQAIQRGIQLIQEGQIWPVQLPAKAIQQLKRLKAQENRQRAREQDDHAAALKIWRKFVEREERILEAAYEAARDSQNQDSLISRLEQLRDGSLPENEAEKLLDYTYCRGEELYQLGLAEWIDEYQPGWDDETAPRPAGMVQSLRVAIIQNPDPDWLDERGYYRDMVPELLAKLSGYKQEARSIPVADFIKAIHRNASEHIKVFLAIQTVVEAVSQVLGVKLTEDLEQRYSEMQAIVNYYNSLLTSKMGETLGPPYYLGMPKLKRLTIGTLRATAQSIQYYKERMAMALGDDWLREALKSLEFQADEGSIAEQLIEDLKVTLERIQSG